MQTQLYLIQNQALLRILVNDLKKMMKMAKQKILKHKSGWECNQASLENNSHLGQYLLGAFLYLS